MEINKGCFKHEMDLNLQHQMFADPNAASPSVNHKKAAPALAEIRRSLGLSQAIVARRAGISQKSVSMFERRINCNHETFRKIAKALLS